MTKAARVVARQEVVHLPRSLSLRLQYRAAVRLQMIQLPRRKVAIWVGNCLTAKKQGNYYIRTSMRLPTPHMCHKLSIPTFDEWRYLSGL